MSFNEMSRNLEDAGSKEARVRELAESLQRRGLAMTKESARQLAESMVETERKVQQRYQEKKDSATQYPKKENVPLQETAPGFAQKVEAPEPTQSSQSYPELKPDMIVKDAVQEPTPAAVAPEPTSPEPVTPAPEPDSAPTPDPEPIPEAPAPQAEPETAAEPAQPAEAAEEYPTLGEDETDHAAEPGDEELAGEEVHVSQPAEQADDGDFVDISEAGKEPEQEAAPEAPEEEAPKENLAKKHGIDITQMFDVNK